MRLSVAYNFLPKTPTVCASCVMDHFGIGLEQGRHVIAEGLEIPIQPGQVVLFTGPSGSGKSSLMRTAAGQLAAGFDPSGINVLDINSLPPGDELLIDAPGLDALESMQLLAQCGLGEARLLLRRPAELSDGQLYRFRLALALSRRPQWLVADEFTATLDRTLAKVIAFNIRRLADRTGVGFLLATTHEDVVEDLAADVHVCCRLDGTIDVKSPASWNEAPPTDVTTVCEPPEKPGFLIPASRKKKRQLRTGSLDQRGDPLRLAVFRSVALPLPSGRADTVSDAAVAWRRTDRHLRVHDAAAVAGWAQSLLRTQRAMGPAQASNAQSKALHAVSRGSASDVSRSRDRGRFRPTVVRALSVAMD